MGSDAGSQITGIVSGLDEGGGAARAAELLPHVYPELRRLAARFLRHERPGHTLQPTALVHEAYLKLVDQTRVSWRGRSHFFAVGARAMRRLLINHARDHQRQKRGGGFRPVTLAEGSVSGGKGLGVEELLSLEQALAQLAQLDERQARVVELRFFGGLTTSEIAEVLGVSRRTVEGDWAHARAWLKRELSQLKEVKTQVRCRGGDP